MRERKNKALKPGREKSPVRVITAQWALDTDCKHQSVVENHLTHDFSPHPQRRSETWMWFKKVEKWCQNRGLERWINVRQIRKNSEPFIMIRHRENMWMVYDSYWLNYRYFTLNTCSECDRPMISDLWWQIWVNSQDIMSVNTPQQGLQVQAEVPAD